MHKIMINNPGNHIANPLLKLADREYATRNEACEAIYAAMYDVIDSEDGCEMVDKSCHPAAPQTTYTIVSDEIYAQYDEVCHDYILREGYASEDGVSATVEEVR